MSSWSSFQFLFAHWLLLLPVLWWLAWNFAKGFQQQSMWTRICDPRLLKNMKASNQGQLRSRWMILILTLSISLAIIAAAGPSWRSESVTVTQSNAARVILLDLSRLMLVQDVKPDRYTQAKRVASKLISTEFDGETALIVFAGAAFVVSPLSRDANTLLAFLKEMSPQTMPIDGNRIDYAINSAQGLLQASIAKRGQIFILSAGTNASESAVQAAFRANQSGHQVSVIAIGTRAGGPLIEATGALSRDANDQFIISKTNFSDLERIARVGKGHYIEVTSGDLPVSFFTTQLEAAANPKSESETAGVNQIPSNQGYWLVWMILPLVLLLFRRNALWMILIIAWIPAEKNLHASDKLWIHSEHRAFQAYQRTDYALAWKLSKDPMLAGSALYRLGKYTQALQLFKQHESAHSYYNRGNIHVRQNRFAEALFAYQTALRLRPDFAAASYNKVLVETYLQQEYESDNENEGSSDEDSANAESDQLSLQARLGSTGQEQNNPADDQQPNSGYGASAQLGTLGFNEQFDGIEERLKLLTPLEPGSDVLPDPKLIEEWIKSLPEASSELFRRKFLRDYERQIRQER